MRNYDFEGGRFLSGDALWEEYRAWSPYQYSSNNPGAWKDPSGESGVATVDHANNHITISSHFVFYGAGLTQEFATSVASVISNKWNAPGAVTIGGVEYTLSFEISFEVVETNVAKNMAAKNGTNALNNFVRIDNADADDIGGGGAYMKGNSGHWSIDSITDEDGNVNYVPAHEYMHGFGIHKHNPFEPEKGAAQNIGIGSNHIPEGMKVDPIVEPNNLRDIFIANRIRVSKVGGEPFNLGFVTNMAP